MDPHLKAAIERQHAAHAAMEEAAAVVEALIGSTEGTAEERAEKRAAATAKFDQAEAEKKAATADIEALEHIAAQRADVPRDLPTNTQASNNTTSTPARITVGREERTYRRDGQFGYFADLAAVTRGDGKALDRLISNNRQAAERAQASGVRLEAAGINQSATSGGEFVPPVWYVDQYAPLLRAGRPGLDAIGTKALPPDTNSLNFPKITTGSAVAVQSDGGSVQNTDLVTTSVTAQVQTEAGRSVASYQFVDLGPVSDQVIMQDLMFAYNTQLDKDIIASSAVTNAKSLLNQSSINSVTYTDATPTGAEFYAPVMQGASQIAKNAFVGTDLIITHPSVWYNILSGVDGSTRPLYLAVGPGFNVMGNGGLDALSDSAGITSTGPVGNIGGIPLYVDANLPTNLGGGTNETRMILLNRMGFDIWESAPRFRVADQASITTLQYQFVAYGYWACCSRQPKMISVLSGTGLIPVSGF